MSIGGAVVPPRQRADARLPAYLVAGFGALIMAFATGRQELAILAAPFLTLAAVGLVAGRPGAVSGSVAVARTVVFEGDTIDGTITMDWEGEADVEVALAGWRGVAPAADATTTWSLGVRNGPVTLPFRLIASAWGVHDPGAVWLRVRRPDGMRIQEQRVAAAPAVRVLPAPLRLDRLLRPAEPRAVSGMHLSRHRGHGTDFADLRPYQPGDRMRDLSWATSARLGEPWVSVHHSERTGTILLLLDTVFSTDAPGTEGLARAARAAWAVASAHLRAQDRVGLLAEGRVTAWLPPRAGRRARWMILEELLAIGRATGDTRAARRRSGRAPIPADALIVAVSSLRSHAFVRDLLHHRRAGRRAAAIVIDTADLLPSPRDEIDAVATRIWVAQREAERHSLERAGVPTVLVTATDAVGPAVSALRRRLGTTHRSGPRARAS